MKALDAMFAFGLPPALMVTRVNRNPVCTVDEGNFSPWLVEQFRDTDVERDTVNVPMTQNVLAPIGDCICVVAENRYELAKADAKLFRRYEEEYAGAKWCPVELSRGRNLVKSDGTVSWRELNPSGNIVAGPVAGLFHYEVETIFPVEGDGSTFYQFEKWWQVMSDSNPALYAAVQTSRSRLVDYTPDYWKLLCFRKGQGLLWMQDLLDNDSIACRKEIAGL